jgi:hypothetical protein
MMAALTLLSGRAQLNSRNVAVLPARPQSITRPSCQAQEMKMRDPGQLSPARAKRSGDVKPFYCRPAGAFSGCIVVENGAYAGMYYAPYIFVKPYVEYTFPVIAPGFSESEEFWWSYELYNAADELETHEERTRDLKVKYDIESVDAPILENYFQYPYYIPQTPGMVQDLKFGTVLSLPNTMDYWDMDILKSSKTFCYGGRNNDQRYPMTYYSGIEPFGSNEYGWWFGKNGCHWLPKPSFFVDGIAQAFEKPTAPYLLNQVVVDCAILEVTGQVDMTCKVYKIDEIPPYQDDGYVVLPDEPGELIAKGRATVTPETADATGDLVFFTLFGEEDGLEYDVTPTIDCAILVVIDGYNDPGMENLKDFSALIGSNVEDDEGYGELAYLKFAAVDEDGNIGDYVWAGLNNFFRSGEMKTGLSIFLSTENPYLTFNYNAEDGEYHFPDEGGLMEKHFGSYTTRSIEFWAWTPSADDAWYISCNDEEVPDWLSIELTDQMQNGEFTGLVNAEVVAEPLPAGVSYREAIVRFEFPGAYIDYKFMQGEGGPVPVPGDVNQDGEVTIADVNALIDMILSGELEMIGDVNGDGEVTIADVNAVIDIILS